MDTQIIKIEYQDRQINTEEYDYYVDKQKSKSKAVICIVIKTDY